MRRRKTIWFVRKNLECIRVLIRQVKTEIAVHDAILVPAAVPAVPQPLIDQLIGGMCLVTAVDPMTYQELFLVAKREGSSTQRFLCACRFAPLVGRYGCQKDAGKAGRE